jgi:rod shape-determining protein MreD
MIALALPAITALIAALFAILPFGAGDTVRAGLSFAPLMVIHYWSARRPQLLPVPLIFALGLVVDVLTHGPLGFWALMALAAAAAAHGEIAMTGQSTATGRAAVYAITMVMLAALSFGIASGYSGQLIDGQPMLLAALAAIVLYPVMAALLMPIDRLWDIQRPSLFTRGA